MITKRFTIFVLLTALTVAFSGCSLKKMLKKAKEQELTVSPSPIELHGDSVKFDVSVKLPTKMLKKNKIYSVKTQYKYNDQIMALGELEFKKEDFPNSDTEEPKLSKRYSFYYSGDDVRLGDVVLVGAASNLNGKELKTAELPVAKGVVTTPRLLEYVQFTAISEHGYNNKEELEPNVVDFFFLKNRSNLRWSERRSDRAKEMKAFIASDNVTRKVILTGTHSPEGSEAINTNLSEDRSQVIKDYYTKTMKQLDVYGQADSIDFITKAVVQDWDLFKKTVNATDVLTDAEKKEVLKIVNSGQGSFIEKEKALQDLPYYQKKLMNKIYPDLRKTRTEVLTVIPKKSDATILLLAKQITKGQAPADTLNREELAYAATLTPSTDEKEAIYKAATQKADDWKSHNNLGAIYLQRAIDAPTEADTKKFADMAQKHLDIAKAKKDAPEVNLNLAGVYLLTDKFDQAVEILEAAQKQNPREEVQQKINAVQGVVLIRLGNYSQAISKLNSGVDADMIDYNLAVAQVANKQLSEANANIEKVMKAKPDFAKAFYLSAVVAARQNNADVMAKNLAKAISLNSELRQYALNDVEFAGFFELPVFKSAVK